MPPTVVSSNAFKSMTNLLYKQKMGWPAHFQFPRNQGMRSVSKITPESKSYGIRRGQKIERNPPAVVDLGWTAPVQARILYMFTANSFFYGRAHSPPVRNIEA